jgi:serine/threonine protein kinase
VSYLLLFSNQLISRLLCNTLQIDLACCVCDAAKSFQNDLRARLTTAEVLQCCLLNSYIDVSLMANALTAKSKGVNLLLGLFELRTEISDVEFSGVAYQTITYMVSALAYSRWGILQDREPLVALILASNCVYRVTLSRTKDCAMGFMLTIAKAKDFAAMEWMLFDYMQGYIRDHTKTTALTSDRKSQVANPFDWTPLNFGSSHWIPLQKEHNFGFLFKTTSDEMIRVKEKYLLQWTAGTLSPGTNVIVKHVNLVVDANVEVGLGNIKVVLSATNSALYAKYPLGIKHPYQAIAEGLSGPLVVMEDVGEPLSVVMRSQQFRQQWTQSASLRRAFYTDVGLSALNLVAKLGLCHNDIRPPNIAFRSDSFCLIDFDFSRGRILSNDLSAFSPSLSAFSSRNRVDQMMIFSVAQIALTVFLLSGSTVFDLDAVTKSVSIWNKERCDSKVDKEFERWVQGKSGRVQEFISACRGATPLPSALAGDSISYLSDVLQQMLV